MAPSAAERQTTKATSRSSPEGARGHRATSVGRTCLTSSPTPVLEQRNSDLGRKEPFHLAPSCPLKCLQVAPHCQGFLICHTYCLSLGILRPSSLHGLPASHITCSNAYCCLHQFSISPWTQLSPAPSHFPQRVAGPSTATPVFPGYPVSSPACTMLAH